MGKLEKEFEKIKNSHKDRIIASTLMTFEEEGIYNMPLLKENYGDAVATTHEGDRAFEVVADLITNHDTETLDKLYEICWRKIRSKVSDKKSYSLQNEE